MGKPRLGIGHGICQIIRQSFCNARAKTNLLKIRIFGERAFGLCVQNEKKSYGSVRRPRERKCFRNFDSYVRERRPGRRAAKPRRVIRLEPLKNMRKCKKPHFSLCNPIKS